MRTDLRHLLLAVAAALPSGGAQAAGGHFDVDDAAVLDPGHCQVETWGGRAPALDASVLHLGPACRVGPVELGLNLDRLGNADGARTLLGPQLKVVIDPLVERLSVGLVLSAATDAAHGGRPWRTLVAPATWWLAETWWLHANVGADWAPSGLRTRRLGLAGEWAAGNGFGLSAERAQSGGEWVSRVGGRFSVSDTLSIDVSAARVGPRASRLYAIGLNREFTR